MTKIKAEELIQNIIQEADYDMYKELFQYYEGEYHSNMRPFLLILSEYVEITED